MEWLEDVLNRGKLADEGSVFAQQLWKRDDSTRVELNSKVLGWVETARLVAWGSSETRQKFDDTATQFQAKLDDEPQWASNLLDDLVGLVRDDGHRFLADRSEPERRYAVVETVRRTPAGYVATEKELSELFGFNREDVRVLVDWAIDRDLLQKRSGTMDAGRHLVVTSNGREWLNDERENLASATRARRSLSVSDWTLDVSFVRDADIRSVLEVNIAELAIARAASLPMASVVLAGAISEGILYDALVVRKVRAMASSKVPKFKGVAKDIETEEWRLHDYVEVAIDLGVLLPHTGKMAHDVLREFRNMIHPKKQVKTSMRPEPPEMNACIAWLEALVRDVMRAPL